MPIVRWMRRAALDLEGVGRRIAIISPASADKLLRRIQARADELALYPGMGRVGRVPGTRELVVHQNYYIVYRVDGFDPKDSPRQTRRPAMAVKCCSDAHLRTTPRHTPN